MPVDFLCKANNFDDFKLMALPVVKKYFPLKGAEEGVTHVQWCLEFKRRNNDKVQKKAYVDWILE